MRTFATALAAAVTLSAGSLMPAAHAAAGQATQFAPPVSTGTCTFKKTEFAASASFDSSSSKSFVNLGDAGSITFHQARTGCVGGTFSANAGNTVTNDSVVLQVTLDGAPCDPLTADYFFANSGTDFSSHAAGFFCGATVAPGAHTIQVQYASHAGGLVEFFQRSLRVDHK